MDKKLENASRNLKEILCALADGEIVQFMEHDDGKWIDYQLNFENILCQEMLECKWRKKPDAFEESWEGWVMFSTCNKNKKEIAKYFWNAAMEHKND